MSTLFHLIFLIFVLSRAAGKKVVYTPNYVPVEILSLKGLEGGKKKTLMKESTPKKVIFQKRRVKRSKRGISLKKGVMKKKVKKRYEVLSKKELKKAKEAISKIKERVKASGKMGFGESERKKSVLKSVMLRAYYDKIWSKIKDSWIMPDTSFIGKEKLQAILIIKIGRDGVVDSIRFEKHSGNIYFDESAIMAIKRASPLPPPPYSLYEGKYLELGIIFNSWENT